MTTWRNKHLNLLIESKLHKSHLKQIIYSKVIEFRPWVKTFLKFLSENNIPIVIISANWLGTDSIKMYFEKEWFLTPNVKIISNEFVWDENGFAKWYDKRVVHVFNKDETVLEEFPEIHKEIENRKNVILLWDSLWDPLMIEGFQYENLLKIGFLNEMSLEQAQKGQPQGISPTGNTNVGAGLVPAQISILKDYQKHYDVLLTWDNNWEFLESLFV